MAEGIQRAPVGPTALPLRVLPLVWSGGDVQEPFIGAHCDNWTGRGEFGVWSWERNGPGTWHGYGVRM